MSVYNEFGGSLKSSAGYRFTKVITQNLNLRTYFGSK